ncbi:uncharacterized protein [Macrobrachium rosenbergii]|uniref:uncharacterized protein isoform X4 n=1 Tax=Macrobrachium rosenbergii TaxID=79674 RepID=UPI0034D3B3A6
MVASIILVTFLLTAGNFAHCQDWENLLFIKMEEVLQKQEAALNQLKDMQGHIEDKLQEMQEKLEHVENNLQELHHEMEHLKGIHQEVKDCLGREDLESFKNISSAGQQELESSLRQEISGVISLLETGVIDECSEGSHNCGDHEACTDNFVNFTCSCLPGFARNGSRCEDIDECAQGKAECSPQAACRNSVGSYSCSCNPPFEGDGRTCEFSCESRPGVVEGLGCVKFVWDQKTWQEMKATCQEAGWRLLQDFTTESLQQVGQAFRYTGWIGVYEGKWMESGRPLQKELWWEGYQVDRSRRCGAIMQVYRPTSTKVIQHDCSEKRQGYCQLLV